MSLPPKGPSFFANVYHPAFNVDADEASEAIERFVNHTRAVGKGVQGLRNIFGKVREARVGQSYSSAPSPRFSRIPRDDRDVESRAIVVVLAALHDHRETSSIGTHDRAQRG